MSTDYRAMAAQCLSEATDAGRLTSHLSEDDIEVVTRTWREARIAARPRRSADRRTVVEART